MIAVALILILAGSLAGSITLWLHGASFWGIVLGYVGGGWAGLLLGLAAVFLVRRLFDLPAPSPSAKKRTRQHQ